MTRHNVSVLGATGSIGDSALDVIARHADRFAVTALTAHRQWEKLAELCVQHRPQVAALTDPAAAKLLQRALAGHGLPTRVLAGEEGQAEAAALPGTDTVIAAIVGAAGLRPTLAAALAGKRILLANKEALVIGGAVFMTIVFVLLATTTKQYLLATIFGVVLGGAFGLMFGSWPPGPGDEVTGGD